ncbi:dTDP-4-dehydrorhamnose reductase [Gloeothece citriformis PCC 7424]|uniref:dTDP-4-dehydrorhamnose reductase n=1 Tax=Gloeothece citriformis (strain PCC 7424) TaxID=65393 RepID=B7K8G8_GLOC7|nr:dTDP-4-dehydrorhamnose reductase [Gloeothece citriformis]ACK69928.1 dTDP-4-dehydrorhamnose reductase [Gloeothece citriformis PCC 7424]
MKKILLIGNNGQVGQELQSTLAPIGDLTGVARDQLDLTQPDNIRQVIQDTHPEIIVNAAAYTAVDKAESETELAYTVNETAPKILAQECQKLGATLIHISTDYVFDGTRGIPLTEEDKTNPIGAYGASKLAGEQAIQDNCQNYIILRTAWVYGTYGKGNFVKTMLRLGADREQLRVVADQIGTPTWAKDIADTITQLIQLEQKVAPGIYHFTNSGVASWYDFAKAIFEEATAIGFPLKIKEVVPITTPEYPTPAKRPAYSVLSNQKLRALLGHYPPHWRDSLKQMLFQLYSKNS